jgi:DUF1680 family protein
LSLATGDPACADHIERTILNGALSGVSLGGRAFFYVNTLQRRTRRVGAVDHETGNGQRAPWFPCACCPPNVMRLLSSWPHYLATSDAEGIQIHQFAAAEIDAEIPAGRVRLAIDTDYPWDGRVSVTIAETPDEPWALSLRVPAWSRAPGLALDADGGRSIPVAARTDGDHAIVERRTWAVGDRLELNLDMDPRTIIADRRIDAVRGAVAFERGPLVYCVETADLPDGGPLEDIQVDPSVAPSPAPRPDLAPGLVGLSLTAVRRSDPPPSWPYAPANGRPQSRGAATAQDVGTPMTVGAVPYFAWANRVVDAMRVWIPARSTRPSDDQSTEGDGSR